MGLDKAIESGKEKRKPYYGSQKVSRSCRHGGDCPWCEGNRTAKTKAKVKAKKKEAEEEIP